MDERIRETSRMRCAAIRAGRVPALAVFTLALAVFTLALAVATARAQSTARRELPGAAEIEARIQTVTQSTLDETSKSALLQVLRDTATALRAAETARAAAAGYEEAIAQAPALLRANKAELAAPVPPDPVASNEKTLEERELALADAQSRLQAEQAKQQEVVEETRKRGERRPKLAGEITARKERAAKVSADLAALGPRDENAPADGLDESRRLLLEAIDEQLRAEILAREKEAASYDGRSELLQTRREVAARRVASAEREVAVWREAVNQRRQEEAAAQAAQARRAALRALAPLREDAELNQKLAESRARISGEIESFDRKLAAARSDLVKHRAAAARLVKRVEIAGLTDAMGELLRKEKANLPSLPNLRRNARDSSAKIVESQLELIDIEEQLSELENLDDAVERKVLELYDPLHGFQKEEIESEVRSLLERRFTFLVDLQKDLNVFFTTLADLRGTEMEILHEVESMGEYVDRRVLWIRSSAPMDLRYLPRETEALFAPSTWNEFVRGSIETITESVWELILIGFGALALLGLRPIARRRLIGLGEQATSARHTSFFTTIHALFVTALLASDLAGVLWLTATVFSHSSRSIVADVGHSVQLTSFVLLMGRWLVELTREDGISTTHFDARPGALKTLRVATRSFLPWALGLSFFVAYAQRRDLEAVGRVVLTTLHVFGVVFAWAILRKKSGLFASRPAGDGSWISRARGGIVFVGIGAPVLLASLSLLGYHYTALELTRRVISTLWIALGAWLIQGLLGRWALLLRRRLALSQAKARREAGPRVDLSSSGEFVVPRPGDQVDLSQVRSQTGRLAQALLLSAIVAGLWWTWVDVLPALGILEEVPLGWSRAASDGAPERPVTLADLTLSFVAIALTWVAARNLPGFLSVTLLTKLPLDAGSRYASTALLTYTISLIGLVSAARFVGLTWTSVQWMAAALTVGLGFGIQEFFANFLAGVIILFERPIRVGDIVTVGDVSGTVTQIRIRATVIVDFDRKELLVPNKEFITGRVVNWTLSDKILRVVLRVGVAYGSDVALTRETLLQLARSHSLVLSEPAPNAFFVEFGDSALLFELRVFVRAPEDILPVRHDLHERVNARFQEHGIEIAFPQQDLHIRSIPEEVRLPRMGRMDPVDEKELP